eukprot:797864-Ditylum_brightwellii.AAC.1
MGVTISGFKVFQVFACEWRSNKEFKFKSVFKWKKTALIRRFAITPVVLKCSSDDVIYDVKANTKCADNDSCVKIPDD